MARLKIPVQANLDVRELACIASTMESSGIRVKTKSMIVEFAIQQTVERYLNSSNAFSEETALDFLARLDIGVSVDNKRHKHAIDMFTRKANADIRLACPDRNDKNRQITSISDSIAEQAALLLKQNAHIYEQNARKASCEEPTFKFSGEEREKQKLALGLTESESVITDEDQQAYDSYVELAKTRNKPIPTIGDFMAGNCPVII